MQARLTDFPDTAPARRVQLCASRLLPMGKQPVMIHRYLRKKERLLRAGRARIRWYYDTPMSFEHHARCDVGLQQFQIACAGVVSVELSSWQLGRHH